MTVDSRSSAEILQSIEMVVQRTKPGSPQFAAIYDIAREGMIGVDLQYFRELVAEEANKRTLWEKLRGETTEELEEARSCLTVAELEHVAVNSRISRRRLASYKYRKASFEANSWLGDLRIAFAREDQTPSRTVAAEKLMGLASDRLKEYVPLTPFQRLRQWIHKIHS